MALHQPNAASRPGFIAGKPVKEAERKAAQDRQEHARLRENDLSNILHFKYLGSHTVRRWRFPGPRLAL